VRGPQYLWAVVPKTAGSFSSITITGTTPATLCVVGIVAGPAVDQP
jgi:hypothetical protein